MQSSGSSLKKIVRDALRHAPEQEAPVWAWPLVSGAAVAAKTEAVAFENGILRVLVPDAQWRAQLADMAPQYVAAINQFVGVQVIRIEFEVAARAKPPRKDSRT
jgi:predicted nucleic acid-binding Zn ribbon protein